MTGPIIASCEDMLASTVELAGLRVIDVGCGDGRFTRFMASEGADVTGIECNAEQLAAAGRHPPVAEERYVGGTGENLPAAPASVDLITFFSSLHHVPVGSQMKALMDAAIALRPGGLLYISEPLASGPSFEMFQPIDDETEIRAAAYDVIRDAATTGLRARQEIIHQTEDKYPDLESLEAEVIRIDPARAAIFEQKRPFLKARFHQFARETHNGDYAFAQPMRVNLLMKP
ncbi:class I SAM-dependent methyltransferase [Aestuariispira insulae]|uniref:Pimeloyl-CoA biosynthesis protein BioC n=1 Tax=Aestuariispira insulae TaxID=1461337 RepID=A0A3D9HWU2_9PROT|nr:class I SAM-dependent methyltransferase [Aestuariispira insulae]RED53879.1 pimeloyl-CoA biosynthesis protein BioC [Aestuariispira insulae]